jgi:hypothetical protein
MSQFVELCFENAGNARTEQIVIDLGNAGIGYEHITGQAGNLVGCIGDNLDFDTFADKAMDIIHDHNGGMSSEVELKTYEEVEHLL